MPTVSETALRLYELLRAYHRGDENAGWPLLHLCEAIAKTLAKPTEFLRYDDTGSGWRRSLDPERCADWLIGWVAQLAGNPPLVGLSVAQQRAVVVDAPGQKRCTTGAMIAAIKSVLTGTKYVDLVERVESANHFIVVTHDGETPDPDAVAAAILSQKEVGLTFEHFVTTTGDLLIDQLDGTINELTGTIDDL